MEVLEKKSIISLMETKVEISESEKNKVFYAKNNYLNSGKSFSIKEAYNIGLTKLDF